MELAPGYRELRPPEAVKDIVACFWVRVAGAAREVRVVPDGCADLVWLRGRGTLVAGPDTEAKLVKVAPGDVMVGMRLRPGAGGGVLGLPLHALRDQRVGAGEIDPAFELEPDREPGDVLARFAAAAAGRRRDPLVAAATRRLGRKEIGAIADEVGLSERQLLRRFRVAAGYGPKTLARVLRFARFVEAIDRGRSDIARLALDFGYADQAHLTRETTRLAGLPPAVLLGARGAVSGDS